jgi:ABC-2 type transport system permease protein
MRNILAIFGKEFRYYFVSPVAYVIFTLFLLLTGYFFYMFVSQFVLMCLQSMQWAQAYQQTPPPMNVNEMVVRPLFGNISIVVLFMLPMVTMRLFAEEKKMGTIELLLTSPVTNWQAVLGKYLAALVFFAAMVVLTGIHQVILVLYGRPEVAPILTAYLGLFLMGASFLAGGLLVSSLTDNQIVAGFVSFGLFLLWWVIGWAENFAGPVFGKFFAYLCVLNHYDDFAKGVIDTKDVVFYLSCIFLGLFLTERTLTAQRWRQ